MKLSHSRQGGTCTRVNAGLICLIGVAAVFMETHQDPDTAPSDGPNMLKLKDLPVLLAELVEIDRIAKRRAALSS